MQLSENQSLKLYNTFGIAAKARYFGKLTTVDDIQSLLEWRTQHDLPNLILGGGSNLLFKQDYPGLVAQVALPGKQLLDADDNAYYVRASAGENWHQFVRWTIAQGFAGLENLSFIPGTVGAAPVQNIGAYGVELVDRFHSLDAVDLQTGGSRTYTQEQCRFAYRDSFFKSVQPERHLITSVTFRLPRKPEWTLSYAGLEEALHGHEPTSERISDAVIRIRQSKLPDPARIGNAGSFFKNPLMAAVDWQALKAQYPDLPGYRQADGSMKTSAAWLIDQCGWKGFREGDAGIYYQHALVLVNHQNATGEQLWQLAQNVIAAVAERFAVVLEPEPRVI